jgi:hypothetical protein
MTPAVRAGLRPHPRVSTPPEPVLPAARAASIRRARSTPAKR